MAEQGAGDQTAPSEARKDPSQDDTMLAPPGTESPTDAAITPRGTGKHLFGWWVPIGCLWIFLALNLILIRNETPDIEASFRAAQSYIGADMPRTEGVHVLNAIVLVLQESYWLVGLVGILITFLMLVSRHLALGSFGSRWVGAATVSVIVAGIYPVGCIYKIAYEADIFIDEFTSGTKIDRAWWNLESPAWDITFVGIILAVALLSVGLVLRRSKNTATSA